MNSVSFFVMLFQTSELRCFYPPRRLKNSLKFIVMAILTLLNKWFSVLHL